MSAARHNCGEPGGALILFCYSQLLKELCML